MPVPSPRGNSVTNDAKYRLRTDVYEALMQDKGATTVTEQVRITGLPRKTLYRIRRGDSPSLATAMHLSEQLGLPLPALFERVREAA